MHRMKALMFLGLAGILIGSGCASRRSIRDSGVQAGGVTRALFGIPGAGRVTAEPRDAEVKAKLEANLNSYKGTLTTAKLLAIAGEPAEKVPVTDGEIWIYRYSEPGAKTAAGAGSGGYLTITLQIDKSSVLSDWRHNNGPVVVDTASGRKAMDIPFLQANQ